jgi:hypothetical protein
MGMSEISVILRLVIGAFCTFLAILLSSKTREPAWLFVIFGIICMYAQVVIVTLEGFGIFDQNILINGIPLIKLVVENVPLIFISAGLILAIVSKSKY